MTTAITERKTQKIALRIVAKAQNDILARLVDRCGSIRNAAQEIGVCSNTLSKWMNFQSQPSRHAIRKRPGFYATLFPKLEELTGRNINDIFPDMPRNARQLLAEPRVTVRETSVTQITAAVEREKLSYQNDQLTRLELADKSTALKEVLKTLSYREREIIAMRYGLGGGYEYSLEECARAFKVTRERIRQIEARAIRKLQMPSRLERLRQVNDDAPPDFVAIDTEAQRKAAMSLAEIVAEKQEETA